MKCRRRLSFELESRFSPKSLIVYHLYQIPNVSSASEKVRTAFGSASRKTISFRGNQKIEFHNIEMKINLQT
jgi:hypothetical protein